jgi:hypothetical protein
MTNLYSIDIKIYGTAYIKADSEEKALEIAKSLHMDGIELREDRDAEIPITGQRFDDPDLPELSLSPAMTLYGPDEDVTPDLVESGIEDEEDDQ